MSTPMPTTSSCPIVGKRATEDLPVEDPSVVNDAKRIKSDVLSGLVVTLEHFADFEALHEAWGTVKLVHEEDRQTRS